MFVVGTTRPTNGEGTIDSFHTILPLFGGTLMPAKGQSSAFVEGRSSDASALKAAIRRVANNGRHGIIRRNPGVENGARSRASRGLPELDDPRRPPSIDVRYEVLTC